MENNKKQKFIITEEEHSKISGIINKYKNKPGVLIPVLNEVQSEIGFLPVEVQKRVAEGLRLPEKEVYGVVTFYSFFSMTPRGKTNIRVCLGTACFVRGGKKIVDRIEKELGIGPGETTQDRKYSVQVNRCLGACGIAPVMVVNEKVYQRVNPEEAVTIIKSYGDVINN
jgi:NADH:ubiquinone oxidoreductase subunit E